MKDDDLLKGWQDRSRRSESHLTLVRSTAKRSRNDRDDAYQAALASRSVLGSMVRLDVIVAWREDHEWEVEPDADPDMRLIIFIPSSRVEYSPLSDNPRSPILQMIRSQLFGLHLAQEEIDIIERDFIEHVRIVLRGNLPGICGMLEIAADHPRGAVGLITER